MKEITIKDEIEPKDTITFCECENPNHIEVYYKWDDDKVYGFIISRDNFKKVIKELEL